MLMMRSILLKINKIIIFLLFVFYNCDAQKTADYFNQIQNEYSKESFVQLEQKYVYDIQAEKENIEIVIESESRFMYLRNANGSLFNRSVYSSNFKKLVDVEANSYVLEDGKYKKIPVKEFPIKSKVGEETFYDDLKEYSIPFSGIAPGTIIEIKTKHLIDEPRILSPIYVGWYYPVKSFEIEFNFDNNIDIQFIQKNFEGLSKELSVKKTKKQTTVRWENQNINKYQFEINAPPVGYFIPHFIPLIRNLTYNNNQIEILANVNSLHKWYYPFIDKIDEGVNNAKINLLVDSIKNNCNNRIEIIEQLYYWVQNNIKYIAFEHGMEGYIPRKPDYIFNNRYGDCKDKTSILYYLLKKAGIQSYFTIIGTQDIPYSFNEIPSPITANHMILSYESDSSFFFLDGTAKFHDLNTPTSFIQGKEAYILFSPDTFFIKTIPPLDAYKNTYVDSINMQISDGKIIGNGNLCLYGYERINFQYNMLNKTMSEKKDLIEAKTQKGNNQYILSDYFTTDLKTFVDSLNIRYTFEINNYSKKIGDELYINMNLNRDFLKSRIDKDRTLPFHIKYKVHNSFFSEFKIPKGYKIYAIPEDAVFQIGEYKYSLKYTKTDSTITYLHQVTIDDMEIEKDEFDNWRLFLNNLEKEYKQTLVLQKKSK